jgi:hypothetical protein
MTQTELARGFGYAAQLHYLMEAGERPVVKATELAVQFLLSKKGKGRK